MRVADEFNAASWKVCWATTYTFEPAFFEAFLLRRLGEPPFNAVVLGDSRRLAETWSHFGAHDAWRVPGVNRRYLVRGVHLDTGAFHAKTVLLGREKRGVLLVGSGNLDLRGLESGREVYARFASGDEPEAFGAWRDWMAGIVGASEDRLLRDRWADLLGRLPWLVAAERGASPFVTNARSPLADQFVGGLVDPIDELHVTAPFFDHDLGALSSLVERTRPKRLFLYVGDGVSVDGVKLELFIGSLDSEVSVRAYVASRDGSRTYVHAKIIAAVSGPRARVLAGSANLSRPALLSTPLHGNVEAGVIRDVEADWATGLFRSHPGLELVDLDIEDVRGFSLFESSPASGLPVRLESASRQADGSVLLASVPLPPPEARLTDGAAVARINGGRSDPMESTHTTQLVWLIDVDGGPVSNRVPVDDLVELARVLALNASAGSDRPRELDPIDRDHPLYRVLADLHQSAVFDVDDTPAHSLVEARRGGDDDPETVEFWSRYFEEELGRDPRARRYSPPEATGGGLFLDDFAALLLQMLNRAPALHELRLLNEVPDPEGEHLEEGHRWSTTQRLRVRAYNVLARWAGLVNEPRVRWFGQLAPVRHYVGILTALARIWPQAQMPEDRDRWLTSEQLARVAGILFGSFIRSERIPGFLVSLDGDSREASLAALRDCGAPQVAGAVAFCVLDRAKPEVFFAWQPFLVPALEWGVIDVDARTAELVQAWTSKRVTTDQVADSILRAATYMDDEHWCSAAVAEWGFRSVRLEKSGNPHVPVDLVVGGAGPILQDPRLVGLTAAALTYTRTTGLRLRVDGDLLVVEPRKTLIGKVRGTTVESAFPLMPSDYVDLEGRGAGFGGLLDHVESRVS
jgi:hypothetical protein